MVLWELTLATAYFLGLRRTYRLALKAQRKILPNNPRIRDFAHKRTRNVFDVAVSAQKKLEGWKKSTGNWIMRRKETPETSSKVVQTPVDPTKPSQSKFILTPSPSPIRPIQMPKNISTTILGLAARKKLQDQGRPFSRLALDHKASLKSNLIRDDIAAYVGLPRRNWAAPSTST